MNNYTPTKRKNINVFHNGKTVKVGYVLGDTFYKRIRGSIHIMRNFKAIFFETSSLLDAKRLGAKFAEVTDTETGKVYRAPIALIWTLGIRTFLCPNQVGFPLNQFNRPEPKNLPIQISFFEAGK
ncbi:MAG: hypothetical protein LC108_06195 [Anaerolineales bacterium]|nr:hypothetical protein [Anaerolineales bacterium]